MLRFRSCLREPVCGVLGNYDTIRMVPGLEDMGIRISLNECEPISRGGDSIYLAGIDDAHFYRVDNIEKAATEIPHDGFYILLSHTPEVYRHAAHAGFDLLLSGHTHGGRICLPGSIPISLSSVLHRQIGCGPWKYHDMVGDTSVGAGSSGAIYSEKRSMQTTDVVQSFLGKRPAPGDRACCETVPPNRQLC
jgi:uncharacterized protein